LCETIRIVGENATARGAESTPIRAGLLAGIRRRRPEFEAAGERAEKLRALPGETVATLRAMGAFWLKTPAELGGAPLAPLDFCDVMEEFGYADAATAWTVMVGNGGTGTAGGWLPDAGAGRVFAPGRPLPLVVGTPGPRGTGRAAPGGYVVSGRWGFASGVSYADWLLGGFRVPGDDGLPDRLLVAVVPKDDVEVVDNWHVAGLQGSGSFDFRMSDVFVPEEMTFERAASACRGGALFRQEAHVFLSNEVPPLCVGIARRALDQIADLADRTARFPGGPALSERAVFRKELGRAQTRVRAARLVHRDAVETALAAAYAGDDLGGAHAAVAAASVYTVETCAEVIADLFSTAAAASCRWPARCSATCATRSPPASTSASPRRTTNASAASVWRSLTADRCRLLAVITNKTHQPATTPHPRISSGPFPGT
jgi:alkylation response protein AidB-like acyl-CoA dehydrogenase